jgi:hypothetical protein
LKAGGVPPTTQPAGHTRPKQLWYAAVFPELVNMEHSAAVLQRLCLHAQRFTSFVSIELPNALLLEIKGSLKLFGPLERLHADIDDWRRSGSRGEATRSPSKISERCPGTWRSCRLLVRPGISNGCRRCAPWV